MERGNKKISNNIKSIKSIKPKFKNCIFSGLLNFGNHLDDDKIIKKSNGTIKKRSERKFIIAPEILVVLYSKFRFIVLFLRLKIMKLENKNNNTII